MAETTFVCPSELHLKKELSALRKARFLRDPETCSSWRSPLASRSVVACSSLSYGNANEGEGYSGANNSSGLHQVEPSPNLALRSGNATKRVFLYNWGQHSCKSSDSGIKLDGETKQGSAQASPEDSPVNPQKVDSKSGTFLDEPVPEFIIERARPDTTTRRIARKSRRSAASKRRNLRDSVIPKLLDLPSRTFGVLSTQRSDDSEDCNSEDLRRSTQELIRRTGYASSSTSPFLSGSGCGNWSCSSRVLRNARKEESSYSVTPASTSSFNRYGHRHPSTIGSWDGTTASADGDERKQMELSRRQGYGIPHYSSKRVKHRGCGGWYSPSLSDTLKRKGSSILCGSQALCHKRRASGIRKQKFLSGTSQGLPLLTNGCDEDRSLVDTASDELSTNFGELDLEALSRLDGRRWSNCGSQEGLGMQLPSGDGEMPSHGSLSQKYRPRTFDEIVGQNIVVQSLHNAILRGRIAPAYLFHGPRGTGKTSTARIFAAALNCLTAGENKPCGFCQECTEFASGNGSNVREVDATNKKGIDRVRNMLKNMHEVASSSRHKVFIIDECHILSSKVWSAFIKFLEEPPLRIVFVFITIDLDNLPRAILSRCQKYVFPKIKEADIISRLRRLSAEEEFDVELDALDLIALNSDGSLRDAETMLDQLALFGKRVTTSLVNDLVGVVSDEKLLDLLEIAMSSDTAETVKRSRELMDSGVDPMALMSQLAGLIMDIIAGTYRLNSSKPSESVLRGRILTDAELDRLQQALRILSDAEKQLRLSSERSTWFTAALLQLGSSHSPEHNHSSGSNSKHSSQKTKTSNWVKGPPACKKSDALLKATQSCLVCTPSTVNMHSDVNVNPSSTFPICVKNADFLPICSQSADSTLMPITCREKDDSECLLTKISPEKLNEVWKRCIEKCHSKTLRQLLSAHGQLISIFEAEGVLVVSIAFGNEHIKARAEGYVSSITNSMEVVLGRHVEVRIGSTPDNRKGRMPYFTDSTGEQTIISLLDKERKLTDGSNVLLGKESYEKPIYLHRKSTENCQGKPQITLNVCESSQVPNASVQGAGSPVFASKENGKLCGAENTSEMSTRIIQTSAVDEQRLESAWLQTMDPGLVKPERNQILPQNGISYQHQTVSKLALAIPSKHWEDELNHEIKALKVSDTHSHHKEDFIGRIGALSPSLLHRATFAASFDKENPEYESGPGCNGLLCWKTRTRHRRKVTQRTHVSSQRVGHLLQFGPCTKSKTTESSFRR